MRCFADTPVFPQNYFSGLSDAISAEDLGELKSPVAKMVYQAIAKRYDYMYAEISSYSHR